MDFSKNNIKQCIMKEKSIFHIKPYVHLQLVWLEQHMTEVEQWKQSITLNRDLEWFGLQLQINRL